LGWELFDLEGYQVVAHSGGYDGMISRQVLVPEANLGIILLTNNNNSLPWAWGFDGITRLLGAKAPTDLVALLLEYQQEEEAHPTSPLPERIADAPPTHALENYTGTFSDQMYGDLEVTLVDDQLHLDFTHTPLFKALLTPWHFDTFRLDWTTEMMLPEGTVTFHSDASGQITSLGVVVENPDFDFTEFDFIKK